MTSSIKVVGAASRSPALFIQGPAANLLPGTAAGVPMSAFPSVTPTITSLAGNPTGYELREGAAPGQHYAGANLGRAAPALLPVTFSVFVKAAGRTSCRLLLGDAAGSGYVWVRFNLITGTSQTLVLGAGVTLVGTGVYARPNGWYKVQVTAVLPQGPEVFALVFAENEAGEDTYPGDPEKGLDLYGPQVEVGSYATAFIPTPAGAGAARSGDIYGLPLGDTLIRERTYQLAYKLMTPGRVVGNRTLIARADGTFRVCLTPAGLHVRLLRSGAPEDWQINAAGANLGWHILHLVDDGVGTVKVYLDGQELKRGPGTVCPSTADTLLGAGAGGAQALDGYLCPGAPALGLPLFQPRALPPEEITQRVTVWMGELTRQTEFDLPL